MADFFIKCAFTFLERGVKERFQKNKNEELRAVNPFSDKTAKLSTRFRRTIKISVNQLS